MGGGTAVIGVGVNVFLGSSSLSGVGVGLAAGLGLGFVLRGGVLSYTYDSYPDYTSR